jgi:dolichol-phosphate mannosyltransferase
MKDCLVVIPTYNEIGTMPVVVYRLLQDGFRVLIVDDNSPDGTGERADELHKDWGSRVQVLHRKEKDGLGRAYIAGFTWALQHTNHYHIAQMDADLSHPPERMEDLYRVAQLDAVDLVIGSRYKPGGGLDQDWPPVRRFLSAGANAYARLLLRTNISDWTGAFKVWTRPLLQAVLDDNPQSTGYCFIIEMTYRAIRDHGAAVIEVPFYFRDRKSGQTKMTLGVQLEAAARVLTMGLLPRRNGK